MRVNICTAIILLAVVESSLNARSVEQVLDRQLNKKGYAVLELKKKRLVLRHAKDDDEYRSNNNHWTTNVHRNKESREYSRDSIPADDALKSKVVNKKSLDKLASMNIDRMQRNRRHYKRDSPDHLGNAKENDLATVDESMKAEAHDLAAAVESEELLQEEEQKSGHVIADSEKSQDEHSNSDENNNQSQYLEEETAPHSGNDNEGDYNGQQSENESSESEVERKDEKKEDYETDTDNTGESDESKKEYDKHVSDSTIQLVKQIGTVFEILAKRQEHLVERMDQLRASLADSIKVIQSSENELILNRKRRDDQVNAVIVEAMNKLSRKDLTNLLSRAKRNAAHPERACVYIDVPVLPLPHIEIQNQPHSADNYAHTTFTGYDDSISSSREHPHVEFNSNEFSHSADWNHYDQSGDEMQVGQDTGLQGNNYQNNEELTSNDISHEKYQTSISHLETNNDKESYDSNKHSVGTSIDLNSVYWLKLPTEYNDSIDKKVYDLLTTVSHSGKDVLIIPVPKRYSTKEDITDGLLQAVQATTFSQKARYLKQDKKQRYQRYLLQ